MAQMNSLPHAKIVLHADGLGTPSPETVRQRARELARIDGRDRYNDIDLERAWREVHGGHAGNVADEDEMPQSISERDMTATDAGHHAPNLRDGDDTVLEELVAEGLDEAAHDQMLAAARMQHLSDLENNGA